MLVPFPPSTSCLGCVFPLHCLVGCVGLVLPQVRTLRACHQAMCFASASGTSRRVPLRTQVGPVTLAVTDPANDTWRSDIHGTSVHLPHREALREGSAWLRGIARFGVPHQTPQFIARASEATLFLKAELHFCLELRPHPLSCMPILCCFS